ncbi:fimbrial biogenesis chaperone [Pseudomonas carnis]|uniref:fimbrial biogenesis chaperone n=1 Tax=Pseudomonas carnis TaxID=2487355 RepID=UPI001E523281|nr:molecular chaperone [Pseudomonas carnis]
MQDLLMILSRRVVRVALSLALGMASHTVHAGVVIDGTRQIYPEPRREVTVRVTNDDKHAPRLVQAWLDAGDAQEAPTLSDVPFVLSPPVFRLDAGKSQSMRLSYTKAPLPTDRESLFWLNVLEVPGATSEFDPTLEDSQRNHFKFAFRIRTKVFFRPTQLPGTPEEAPGLLRWSVERGAQGSVIQVHNPSAYHVTFNDIVLLMGSGPEAEKLSLTEGMVEPGGTLKVPVPKAAKVIPADARVDFTYINDFGGFSSVQPAVLHR